MPNIAAWKGLSATIRVTARQAEYSVRPGAGCARLLSGVTRVKGVDGHTMIDGTSLKVP